MPVIIIMMTRTRIMMISLIRQVEQDVYTWESIPA